MITLKVATGTTVDLEFDVEHWDAVSDWAAVFNVHWRTTGPKVLGDYTADPLRQHCIGFIPARQGGVPYTAEEIRQSLQQRGIK